MRRSKKNIVEKKYVLNFQSTAVSVKHVDANKRLVLYFGAHDDHFRMTLMKITEVEVDSIEALLNAKFERCATHLSQWKQTKRLIRFAIVVHVGKIERANKLNCFFHSFHLTNVILFQLLIFLCIFSIDKRRFSILSRSNSNVVSSTRTRNTLPSNVDRSLASPANATFTAFTIAAK